MLFHNSLYHILKLVQKPDQLRGRQVVLIRGRQRGAKKGPPTRHIQALFRNYEPGGAR